MAAATFANRELWRASLGVLEPHSHFSEPRPVHWCPILGGESTRANVLFFLPQTPYSASSKLVLGWPLRMFTSLQDTRRLLSRPHTLYSLLSSLGADGAFGKVFHEPAKTRAAWRGDTRPTPGPRSRARGSMSGLLGPRPERWKLCPRRKNLTIGVSGR